MTGGRTRDVRFNTESGKFVATIGGRGIIYEEIGKWNPIKEACMLAINKKNHIY